MDLRKSFDATPWDKSGSAFNGLNRTQSRYLALFFILLGISLADPPFSILPTDFINLFVAQKLSQFIGISFEFAILLSYTILAWSLILLGIWIYPYNTHILLNSYINKAKSFIQKSIQNPTSIIMGIIIFFIMYNLYKGWLL